MVHKGYAKSVQISGRFLGVPIIRRITVIRRIIAFWGLDWVFFVFGETTISHRG